MCHSPTENCVFASDANNHEILAFDPRTGVEPILSISEVSNSKCATLANPRGVAFDLSGNLVVVDSGNARVCVMKT